MEEGGGHGDGRLRAVLKVRDFGLVGWRRDNLGVPRGREKRDGKEGEHVCWNRPFIEL